ncbi:MAG TPA: amino acid adenylation domain-containing protein [Thermoanaerobaculia bacterium]|nr:amino acid adenylation domain-containing protein [Thermoanaerobaculia bacterium]
MRYALTPTQSGMLFHRLLDPSSGADVQQLVCTPADLDIIRRALLRHDVLRTRFLWQGLPSPLQETVDEVELPVSRHDSLDQYLIEDRRRGFELDRAPLMRFAVIDDATAVWTYHAALLDGRSVNLLLTGSAEPRPFREYVEWLEQRDLAAAEGYWREKLKGFAAPTPLPVSHERGTGFGRIPLRARGDLTAAWALLLQRYSGESDVAFGVAESRRPPGFENVLGMFINTIPVRSTDLDLHPEHAHAPLASIQKWSEVTPLFDSIVLLDEKPVRGTLHEQTTYPLAIATDAITYDRTRIDDATAARVAGHLQNVLEGRELLTERERTQILVEWNDTARDYDLDRCVHELVEAQVARTPDRVAITFEGASLTYRELDDRANRIAASLRTRGVGPDVFVGILLERSLDLVAALLGILKAGGAYVPLDPMYPKDRIDYMIEDSGAPIVITKDNLAQLLAVSPNPTSNQQPATSNNLAYVIYTSGSTGKPKGVQLPHGAVVNFLETMRERPGLTAEDVLLAVTTLSFDIAGLELWLPLTTGARIELASRETASDGRALMHAMRGVSIMQATPATWRMLLEAGWSGDPRLKILCGGEALSNDLARQLLARCDSLWNMYGPTETTIWSTVQRVEQQTAATVPIGKPIANTTVYVLDKELQPVPVGVSGELHIGGAGVARGYLNRPELTAERFIADPFRPNARVYKTGDAVRWLPDGRIEYLNRLDNQVKVRGYRIELGEIESALRKHPQVNDAVVIVRNAALAAYLIARDSALSTSQLRDFLRASLPDYMVPAFFVTLDAFPLTPNGKVDRKALPAPDHRGREAEESFVPPRDEVETRLAQIWCDVLGLPSASVHDNFFESGGESILALRMFVRIEQELGRKLPLATLLQANTIAALANALRDEPAADQEWSSLVPLQPNGTKRPFFCIHGIGGNILNYRPLAQHLGPDQPFYALQARGLNREQEPLTRVEDYARVYLEEIRRVQPHGPYLLGGLSFGGIVAYEMALQLREKGEEAALVALFDSQPVGYTTIVAEDGTKTSKFRSRLTTHAGLLLRGPNRFRYFTKRVRRVWRKVVYKSWQTAVAGFRKVGRPIPKALYDVQQAGYLALRDYRPRTYPGPVTFFYAENEPEGFTREKQLGWAMLAEGGLESVPVPGEHNTSLSEPHVGVVAARLAERLEAVSGKLTSQPFTRTLREWPAISSAS